MASDPGEDLAAGGVADAFAAAAFSVAFADGAVEEGLRVVDAHVWDFGRFAADHAVVVVAGGCVIAAVVTERGDARGFALEIPRGALAAGALEAVGTVAAVWFDFVFGADGGGTGTAFFRVAFAVGGPADAGGGSKLAVVATFFVRVAGRWLALL